MRPPATAKSKFFAIATLWRRALKLVACLLLPLGRRTSSTGDGIRSTSACAHGPTDFTSPFDS